MQNLCLTAESPLTIGIHSDREWQEYVMRMKDAIHPSQHRRMNSVNRYALVTNDILSAIRHGDKDYCYTVHQVADILAFEPNIKTRFVPDGKYIEVWLDKTMSSNLIRHNRFIC